MLESLTADSFAPHVGSVFRVGEDRIEMKLVSVERRTSPFPAKSREPFSLLFLAPPDTRLPQSIYPMEHEVMGRLEIFIVPVGPGYDKPHYEAVFN